MPSCDLLEKSYFCSIANNLRFIVLIVYRLWFAWKIVLLQYRKQPDTEYWGDGLVVICLKNRTFAVSQTTVWNIPLSPFLLWFAWKIVLLQYRKQLSCWFAAAKHVVICLKNRTFAVSQTTYDVIGCNEIELWFAWKIVLLQYRKQLFWRKLCVFTCCDLLEKSYFCSIANNIKYNEPCYE